MSTRSSKRIKVENSAVSDSDDQKVAKEEDVNNYQGVSDYERIRLENIKKNEEFLKNLGLDNIKSSLIVPRLAAPSRRGIYVCCIYTYMYASCIHMHV